MALNFVQTRILSFIFQLGLLVASDRSLNLSWQRKPVKPVKGLNLTQKRNHIETSERVKFMKGLSLTQQDEILF